MLQSKRIFLVLCLVTALLESDGASKYYTDENRPYEFGFNIEGEQHRHEKKGNVNKRAQLSVATRDLKSDLARNLILISIFY